jgi:hypothetical protein
MSKCNRCSHEQVCKYKATFEEKEQQLLKVIADESSENFCNIEITCKHFAEFLPSYWPNGTKTITNPFDITTTPTTNKNPCDDCWFTKRLNSGEIYIGDSPCEWCQHYPFKVTCGTGKITTTGTTSAKDKEIK